MKISGIKQKLILLLLLCDLIFGFYLDKEKTLLLLKNYFNLKGELITEEVNIMDSLQAFVEPFVKEREDQIVENIVNNLIKESNGQLDKEEALKKAEFLIKSH